MVIYLGITAKYTGFTMYIELVTNPHIVIHIIDVNIVNMFVLQINNLKYFYWVFQL